MCGVLAKGKAIRTTKSLEDAAALFASKNKTAKIGKIAQSRNAITAAAKSLLVTKILEGRFFCEIKGWSIFPGFCGEKI